MAGGLGLRKPTDDRHVRRWSLTPGTMPSTPTPVVIGSNWYHRFDDPVFLNGAYWLVRPGTPEAEWGGIRGGHCTCLRPDAISDLWYPYYDQGSEGACVGFGWARYASLVNRQRYDGQKLYEDAQKIDEWDDTPPEEGTSVRAGGDVMRTTGPLRILRNGVRDPHGPYAYDGISQNRWATSIAEIAACLDPVGAGKKIRARGWVRLLNSWGTGYPKEVRVDLDTLRILIIEQQGEATIAIDKPAFPNV
jgi:hypothetical protein